MEDNSKNDPAMMLALAIRYAELSGISIADAIEELRRETEVETEKDQFKWMC